jgi:glyoxylase-like metal-dependent hydrolase (beta-lactamase superfamily II)
MLSRFGGGYDYAVVYLVDSTLLIDTGFPWARRRLRKVLIELGADATITTVVNTHYHEDHTGNNDLLVDLCDADIFAHRDGVSEIRFPPRLKWYRSFLFGPAKPSEATAAPGQFSTPNFSLDVIETPGHCPGHICLWEPEKRWLFSGDLYISADLDSQLCDADGPQWVASLQRVIDMKPMALMDAHGTVITGERKVNEHLQRKLDFLIEIRNRIQRYSTSAQSVESLTRKVFDKGELVDWLSFGDGWLSMITGSDFSRSNIVSTFLREHSDK